MSSFLQSDNTIDVISESTRDLYEEFFGPIDGGAPPLVTASTNLGEILVELGLIESKTWARKNGWLREVAPGFHEVTFGKGRIKIYLFIALKPS